MKKEFYSPMERILIEGAQKLTTKEVCEAAIETKKQLNDALTLDLMLLELEEQIGLMDGLPVEEVPANG